MSWEYIGPAVTFPVATQVQTQTSTRTSSLVSLPPLPPPKRTFSEIINDAVVNIGKRSVQLLSVAAVQVVKTAKRRLVSQNDGTRAPGSSPRRSSPRRFSPRFRSIPSRSSPIFRQDLSSTPGRRPATPVTPPRFLNKTRPYLMPGTYPITPPHSPLVRKSSVANGTVTPQHAIGSMVTNPSQASEAPATPQSQTADARATTPPDVVDLWLNYCAPPSPMVIIPSEDSEAPATDPYYWAWDPVHGIDEAADFWLSCYPSPPPKANTPPHPAETSVTSPALAEDDWATDIDTECPQTWDQLTTTALQELKPTPSQCFDELDELIETTRSSSSTTGTSGSASDGLIESTRSSSSTTGTSGSASDELIESTRSSSSILKHRVPLTQSTNAVSMGKQAPSIPKASVKFLEEPVSRYKKYAPGEPIDFPTPTSTVDSAASSPFEELPWTPSPETMRSLRRTAQSGTPTRENSPTSYMNTPDRSPSPPPKFGLINLENLQIGGRRTVEEQIQEEIAAYEKEKGAAEKAARAKAASIARVNAAEDKERKENGWRRLPSEPVIPPLTVDWETKVQDTLAKSATQTVATTCSGQKITRRDIGKVMPQANHDDMRGWLNDEIVDGYMEHIIDHGHKIRGHKRGETPKLHAFNSFFYNNLRDRGADSVKRWAKRAKIGGKDLMKVEYVFIPVNTNDAHWTLLVVSPKWKRIEYFDSMHGSAAGHVKNIKRWIKSELGAEYNDREWQVVEDRRFPGRGKGPTQHNNSDCGVFTVTTAKMIMLEVEPMAVTAGDIPLQRRRMVAEILNGGFSEDLIPHLVFD